MTGVCPVICRPNWGFHPSSEWRRPRRAHINTKESLCVLTTAAIDQELLLFLCVSERWKSRYLGAPLWRFTGFHLMLSGCDKKKKRWRFEMEKHSMLRPNQAW